MRTRAKGCVSQGATQRLTFGGTKCANDAVVNALDIVASLTISLGDPIVQDSTNAANTTLTLENGMEIAFGKAGLKECVCLGLTEQRLNEITSINRMNVNAN